MELFKEDFVEGAIDILTLLVKSGLVPSKSEARRAVLQGGVSIGDEKIQDIQYVLSMDQMLTEELILKRGKKNFRKIVMK